MPLLTRRRLLETGLAASAALIGADSILESAIAETQTDAAHGHAEVPSPSEELTRQKSPRERLLLDFGWRFHFGNADDAEKDFRYGAATREGTFAKAGQNWLHNPSDGPLQHSFDDTAWRIVDLPHDWAVELPFVEVERSRLSVHAAHGGKALGRDFPETSIGWYSRTFEISAKDEGLRLSVEFDGVFRDSIVFFNGFYLGRNLSGYAPFSFDVTDYVNYGGNNVITVRVDATLNEGWYYEGAGIYRHTWLIKTDRLHIAKWGIAVRTEVRGGGAQVSIETEILNESRESVSGHLISRIVDSSGKVVATVPPSRFDISAHGRLTLHTQSSLVRAMLWSVDEPNLYRLVSQIVSGDRITDYDETTFGVRSIRFDPDQGFFLNGKHIKIKGTCSHQDHAGVGIAVPDRIHSDRVALLKQMGSNGWRTAHNIVATELLDACDRQGMMVMAETRLMASTPEGLSELERMIRRDRNHPSIIIWSLANEEYFYQGTPTGARIVSSMKLLAKKLDPTRPLTAAMNGGWVRQGISGVIDVQGFNYWNGKLPDEKPERQGLPEYTDIDNFHLQFPQLPTIGTETANGSSTRGIYETDPDRGYVAAYKGGCSDCKTDAEKWWTIFDERAFLSGGFTWAGFDYRGEPNPFDHVSISSQSGILDTCGFPKDIYYYYKSWWGSEPVMHLFPHWNWSGKEGQDVDVRCYSNMDSVELFLNGKTLGSKPVIRNSHLCWRVKYEPGTIEAKGSKNGMVVLTERRETTGGPAKLILRPDLTEIAADGEDVGSIVVEVHDSQGRIVPTASNTIRFTLLGEGKIIGVGNGDPSCHEADRPESPKSAVRSAFNGLCMVFFQGAKEPGTIQLEVTADDLESAQVGIRSKAIELRPSVA
jgi:beta-galactosidase